MLPLAAIPQMFWLALVVFLGVTINAKGYSKGCSQPMSIGAGQSDITGPIAGVGLMGYGTLEHRATGLHMRMRSRALVITQPCQQKTVALVINDQGMIFDNLRQDVLGELTRRFPGVFHHENLMLAATHTHAAPGGYAHHRLYNITTLGFLPDVYAAMVQGTVEAISKAYGNRRAGQLLVSQGTLAEAGYNRSLAAYHQNPLAERQRYTSDTDQSMILLKAKDLKGELIAAFNWFAVHPVSLPMSSQLVSGDNKGLAAYLLEKKYGVTYRNEREFVAGFLQANSGDVSPYPIHIKDYDNVNYWDYLQTSAEKQFAKADQLMQEAHTTLSPQVDFAGSYHDMNGFELEDSKTCRGMLGVAFAAGTENGAPVPIFKEGTRYGYEWPELTLMPEAQSCHGEKVILLPTALASTSWTPHVLYFQLIRLGELAIIGVPMEVTTMAGRRLKATVAAALKDAGVKYVALTGLANDYAHYVTTAEEYAAQHYEGGSNLFGKHSLAAYQKIYRDLAQGIQGEKKRLVAAMTEDISHQKFFLQPGVLMDSAPLDKDFGEPVQATKKRYDRKRSIAVEFWGGHPKNLDTRNQTVMTVEKKNGETYIPIAFDWDANTRVDWRRSGLTKAIYKVRWQPEEEDKGVFRICHRGAAKALAGKVTPYQGCTASFEVY